MPSSNTQLIQPLTDDNHWPYRAMRFAFAALALLWISFPPVGLWWLAWFATVPLIWLVMLPKLPGQKPYLEIWIAGLFYWLATFYFIPLPFWALWFGWIAVCLYMSIYTPLFVFVTRVLVHRFRFPVVVAVPVVWTGIEWIRCHVATGMAMACLSHTQFKQPLLIQVADLSGAYTLTFAMTMFAAGMAVAAGVWLKILSGDKAQSNQRMSPVAALITSLLVVGVVMGYGQFRLTEDFEKGSEKISVALIQSSIDKVFEPQTLAETTREFEQYRELTLAARAKWPELDLIVWPESSFPTADLLSDFDSERTKELFEASMAENWAWVTGYPDLYSRPVPLLACTATVDPAQSNDMFNSAVLIGDKGLVTDRYFKNHRVMFGEYVPFSDWFPIIKKFSPLGDGLAAGKEFKSFQFKEINIAPSICFESTIPHLIRQQVNRLDYEDYAEPDVLINLTNDGWFFGTSCLDLHLACNVFRAVEMRKPHLVCANTGFSAEIDSCGRLLQIGKRRDVDLLKVEIVRIKRTSIYRLIGDLVPMVFGGLCVLVCLFAFSQNRRHDRDVNNVGDAATA